MALPSLLAQCGIETADLSTSPEFLDKPSFQVAGVTDNTYRGGHGADTTLRSTEALAKSADAMAAPHADDNPVLTVQKLEKAATLNPTEENFFNWGAELLAHRAPRPAAEVFERGLRRYSKSTRMALGLATAHYASGSYAAAANCFFYAADLQATDAVPYRFLHEVQAKEIVDEPGYGERLARFAKLQPKNPYAVFYYGCFLANQNKPDALPVLQQAIVLDPQNSLAYLRIGEINDKEGKTGEAMDAYRAALKIDPALAEAHYRLAADYRSSGKSEKAHEEISIYQQLDKLSSEKLEQERSALLQFVVQLRQ